jgi:hypothetical protein
MKNKIGQKQIPTFLGIGVLIVSLIAAVGAMLGGPQVFAPRATPQTTPKKVKITNVRDTGFSVSFLTDESTTGFVKYGIAATALKSQAGDDRDQLSGNVGQFTAHHITLRDLQPDTQYFFTIGTTSNSQFNNNGVPFSIKTAKKAGNPSAAKTAYGTVMSASGNPAVGSIVYIQIDGVGELSALVKDSGSWAIPLSNARTVDGTQIAQISPTDTMTILVQGPEVAATASLSITIDKSQPVSTITLGQNSVSTESTSQTVDEATAGGTGEVPNEDPSQLTDNTSPEVTAAPQPTAEATTGVGGIDSSLTQESPLPVSTSAAEVATQTPENDVIDISDTTHQVVTTQQPVITGLVPANVIVSIEVHSETEIKTQIQSDDTGSFTVDLAALAANQNLEPGEHTVKISYKDPQTGKVVTETRTFTVEPKDSSTLLALASPQPFGTSNPFPISTSTPTSSASASPSAKPRTILPATASALPVSGSVTTTFILIFSGIFFLLAGAWSYVAAVKYQRDEE